MFFIHIILFACLDSKQEVVLPSTGNPNPSDNSEGLEPNVPPPTLDDGCQATHTWQKNAPKANTGVTVTSTLDTSRVVDGILVDFLLTDGEIAYGIMCPSRTISVEVPTNLGTVSLAVFVDANQNGPSKDDLQGVSKPISITTENIDVPSISLSTTPVPLFNFASE